ncbi:methyl-accepting chemotaxis protein [Clostridium botulinum]|uniref:Methyl-accepting chemotaxis protein n=2 Tax=Clostridium botulinum TaxID=1491 RepID=A5I2P5_CLOBH|nr:methyl-accepting chemotaxis protein [Clostridium botulinum]ABS33410.1 methyl-accepting chemotaxis protein [Clostridium botulinum A str. ATCC 19397]ABS37600.1 methyl-accepting chemotaxis protein [Clostridium botulinum A str. Hall]ACA44451.1 methyl-accepting chemotaxis protein [Clostridium botulinum B1 str. Okra]APC81768.1 methyl-accepting chemotaxis (MCP) signaling domain protein [Clostridium botulinum]APH23820.1 methyl-accepting chemotaxis (MCP) signaling domain protein [Clostridium botulin
MKFKTMKGKMLTYFLSLFLIICIAISFMAYFMSKRMIERKASSLMSEVSRQAVQNIEARLNGTLDSIETVANMPTIKDPKLGWDKKKTILDEEIKLHGHVKMGIVGKDGQSIQTDGTTVNIKDRNYFKETMEGKRTISEPIVSKVDGKVVIIYTVPIKNGNTIMGALTAVREGNDISNISNSIKVGESGGAYLIDSTGTVIAHKNKESVIKRENSIKDAQSNEELKPIAAIEKSMIEGKEGIGQYKYKGAEKYISYSPMKSTGWSLAIYAPKNEILKEVSEITRNIIIVSILGIGIALVCIWFISTQISNNLISMRDSLNIVATGDLTTNVDSKIEKEKDEIGHMARALSKTVLSIGNMINSLKGSSFNIDDKANNLAAISEEFTATTENVSTAIQEVATGATNQAQALTEIVSMLNDFSDKINSTVNNIEEIDGMSKEIDEKANVSNKDMKELLNSIENLTKVFENFETKIWTMESNVQKINEITNLINDIAEKTNLLALNAAIEAARAGESGKGFAVVAEEIRKLAEMSRKSSEDIYTIVNGVLEDTKDMVKSSNEVNEKLNGQRSTADEAMNSFMEISKSVTNMIPKIRNINNSANIIEKNKNEILNKSETIASISQEISASAEEISASSEEMSASSEEVANTAQSLNDMTQDMLDEMNKFKTE